MMRLAVVCGICAALLMGCRSGGVGSPGQPRWVMDTTVAATPLSPKTAGEPSDDLLLWQGGPGAFVLMDLETGTQRTIPLPVKYPLRPSRSPDRSLIAAEASHEGNTKLMVATPRGDATFLDLGLSQSYGEIDPIKWSPDGKRIAFLAHDINDAYCQAYVVEVRSGKVSRMRQHGGRYSGLTWAPEGNRLALATVENLRIEQYADIIDTWWRSTVFVVDLDAGTATTLARGIRNVTALSWSPAGGRILVDHLNGAGILDVRSGRMRALPGSGYSRTQPQWSPDGMELLTTKRREHDAPGIYEIFGSVVRLKPDGTVIEEWERADEIWEICYSPDGKQIIRQHSGSDALIISDLDGSRERVLSKDSKNTSLYGALQP